MEKTIYCDNAATSWPKPAEVTNEMVRFHLEIGGNPGRSGHRMSLEAGRLLLDSREKLALFFGVDDPFSMILTSGATHGLNIATLGLLKNGDHVIASPCEHNAVMRPLRYLEQHCGIQISLLACDKNGVIDLESMHSLIKKNTRALYLQHSSNVTGAIQPLADAGRIASEHGIVFCIDAAGSAGAVPVNINDIHADLFAFSGHKSLLGPQGTGGIYIKPGLEKKIRPLMFGGTGSRSEEEIQPDFMPDKYEPGTPNTVGFAGLSAGIEYILERGIKNIREHEVNVTQRFLDEIAEIPGIKIYGPATAKERTAVVSINIKDIPPSGISGILDDEFGIMTRPGLHCAPAAHKTTGTFPQGTVRFSFGPTTTIDEIDIIIASLKNITGRML